MWTKNPLLVIIVASYVCHVAECNAAQCCESTIKFVLVVLNKISEILGNCIGYPPPAQKSNSTAAPTLPKTPVPVSQTVPPVKKPQLNKPTRPMVQEPHEEESPNPSASPPDQKAPPTATPKPTLSYVSLDIKPKHLSRVPLGALKIEWNEVAEIDHYSVLVNKLQLNENDGLERKEITKQTNIPPTQKEMVATATDRAFYEIKVDAFKFSYNTKWTIKETVLVVSTDLPSAEVTLMKIKHPTSSNGRSPTAKKGTWQLEWESVSDAKFYDLLVYNEGKVVKFRFGSHFNKESINSNNLGRHDVLLTAWKTDTDGRISTLTWGHGSVIVVE